jgi:hypothetical protein
VLLELAKFIKGCVSYSFTKGQTPEEDVISCTSCDKDYYELNKKCVEDKVKTMCTDNSYEKIDNMDTCTTCAVSRGYFAVNVVKTETSTKQVCLRGKSSDPVNPVDGDTSKIFWIIGICVAGMAGIGLIIWLIVKSKNSESDDLYDSMISNGPI